MHADHDIIESIRRGDPRGLRTVYERYTSHARRWVTQNGGSTADAQDVFQEAVLAVYEKALDPNFTLTCPLGALLHLIYTRKWIDRLRQKKRETEVRNAEADRYESESDPDVLTLAADAEALHERQTMLARSFQNLSDLCQKLLRLLADGTAPKIAAEQLGMNSTDTLYRRKNACSERWRTLFQEQSNAILP